MYAFHKIQTAATNYIARIKLLLFVFAPQCGSHLTKMSTAQQRQRAVTVNIKSKQLPLFAFAWRVPGDVYLTTRDINMFILYSSFVRCFHYINHNVLVTYQFYTTCHVYGHERHIYLETFQVIFVYGDYISHYY